LHTPLNIANSIKLTYGSLNSENGDLIEIPTIGDENSKNEVSLSVVHDIILARVEETLMILAKMIENSGLKDQIGAGIVLTGGFAKMEGIKDYAGVFFDSKPVRVAKPKELEGLFDNLRSPEYSCAVGLVMHYAGGYTPYEIDVNKRVRHSNESFLDTQNKMNLKDDIRLNDKKDEQISEDKETDEEKQGMIDITQRDEKMDKNGGVSKFMSWLSQLF
jgi:cell division protein FtsA